MKIADKDRITNVVWPQSYSLSIKTAFGVELSRISIAKIPKAAVVKTRLATRDNAIIAAEYMPKLLNRHIGDRSISLNTELSDAAVPICA